MILILHKITINLTAPIDTLTVHVRSISQDNSGIKYYNGKVVNSKLVELDKLHYPDDEDIDELFTICKSMIRGGISDDKNYIQKNLKSVDNFVHHIKANNIIIDEEFIKLSRLTSGAHIFSFRGKELEEKVKMFKYDNMNSNFSKRVVNMNNKVRRISILLFKKSTNDNLKTKEEKLKQDNFKSNDRKSMQNIKEADYKEVYSLLGELEKKQLRNKIIQTFETNSKQNIEKDKNKEKILNNFNEDFRLYKIHEKIKAKYDNRELKCIKI